MTCPKCQGSPFWCMCKADLPESKHFYYAADDCRSVRKPIPLYTADQMRAYAALSSPPTDGAKPAGEPLAVEALRYYRDHCSGAEPSLSVFHRMVDEALAHPGANPMGDAWPGYIAGVIETYLQSNPKADVRERAIAGIIERRMYLAAAPDSQGTAQYMRGFNDAKAQFSASQGAPKPVAQAAMREAIAFLDDYFGNHQGNEIARKLEAALSAQSPAGQEDAS